MIRKLIPFLLVLSLKLFATQYDDTILSLEAKIFIKMTLLSEDRDSTRDDTLRIFIIARECDFGSAQKFKGMIVDRYPHRVRGKKVIVAVKEFSSLMSYPDAIIVLKHSQQQLKEIAFWANEHKVISFGYDPAYMQMGILASLYIGKSLKPYLNKSIMQHYHFKFNPYLLELSKFYR